MPPASSALPGVTAVIPAYNMEAYLERAVRSAAAQTYPNLSILVIDDGSTDRTRAIADSLANEFPAMRVVTTANGGVAAARNRGTELAETPWVAYLDADDLWHPAKIERQVAALLPHAADESWAGCYTLSRFIDREDRVIGNDFCSVARGGFFEQHLHRNHLGNGSNLLVRRDVALALGGFDPGYAARGIGGTEDYDFQLRLLLEHKLELVREFLVGYRVYPGQMSADPQRMGRARLEVVRRALAASDMPANGTAYVMTHNRLVFAHRLLLAGHWLRGAAALLGTALARPLDALLLLREIAVTARMRRKAAGASPDSGDDLPAATFAEYDPLDGVTPHDDLRTRPRIKMRDLRRAAS